MTVILNSENPRTLDQSFNRLKESCIKIDENSVREFLFDFAYRIVELEGIDRTDPKNKGFIEFIMRNYWSVASDSILKDSMHLDLNENYFYKCCDIDEAIEAFTNAPQNIYSYQVFQKAKESGKFVPCSELAEAF